ncbi:MAG: CpsB/CapC family capsule biosynthesis tyrosine phosphatase [Pseudomonadota bacterium]
MPLNLSNFIDIHVHILPGIDDGPKNLEESAALAQCYTDVGITQVIATPHYIPGTAWAASSQRIVEKITELQGYLQDKNIPLTIFPGMEIAFHKKFQAHLTSDTFLPLGASSYYLLEPSFTDSAEALLLCLDQLLGQNKKIILAHPERIPALRAMADVFDEYVQKGMKIQINIGSLLGRFGSDSQNAGLHLIDKNCVHYLASDAHGINSRKPPTEKEWLDLETHLGPDLLEQLCCINPVQLLGDKN